ncbi:MAG: hypothetical protein RSG75_11215 [Cellulosilyticaceae bacterium]
MGYNEAVRDGVRMEKRKYNNVYYPSCHICGEETLAQTYIPSNVYTCQSCKARNKMQKSEANRGRGRFPHPRSGGDEHAKKTFKTMQEPGVSRTYPR